MQRERSIKLSKKRTVSGDKSSLVARAEHREREDKPNEEVLRPKSEMGRKETGRKLGREDRIFGRLKYQNRDFGGCFKRATQDQ